MKIHCVWSLHLELEILGDVVEDAEDEDGEDVLVGGPVVGQLEEGVAHRDVALDGDRHRCVDRSCGRTHAGYLLILIYFLSSEKDTLILKILKSII